MIKNKDKIAQDKAKELEESERKKKEEQDKKNIIEKAKAKLQAALDKDTTDKKVK